MRLVLFATLLAACGGSDGSTVDAALGDGAAAHKRVFVTSTTYRGDFATASGTSFEVQDPGIVGANKLCQTAADAGALGGTWKAIIDQPGGGLDAFVDVGPWYRLDGTLVFNNKAQLKTTPAAPINIDELGNSQSDASSQCVWTGMQAGGAPLPGCAMGSFGIWTFGNSAQFGNVGDLNASDSKWLEDSREPCSSPCHLYCIEQ